MSGVRRKLADAATEDYELIAHALRYGLKATTTRKKKCECGRWVELEFVDQAARNRAVEIWLNQGFGTLAKPAEDVKAGSTRDALRDIRGAGDEELGALVRGADT